MDFLIFDKQTGETVLTGDSALMLLHRFLEEYPEILQWCLCSQEDGDDILEELTAEG